MMRKITLLGLVMGLVFSISAQDGTWSYYSNDVTNYSNNFKVNSTNFNEQKNCVFVSTFNNGIFKIDTSGYEQIIDVSSDIIQSTITGDTIILLNEGIVLYNIEGDLIDSIYINDLKSFVKSGDRFFAISTYDVDGGAEPSHYLMISEFSTNFDLISVDSTNIYHSWGSDEGPEIEIHPLNFESFRFALKNYSEYELYEYVKSDTNKVSQLLHTNNLTYYGQNSRSIFGNKVILKTQEGSYNPNYGSRNITILVYDENIDTVELDEYQSFYSSTAYTADENHLYIGKYVYDIESLIITDSLDSDGLYYDDNYLLNSLDNNNFIYSSVNKISYLNSDFEHKCKYHYLSDNNVEITVEEDHPKLVWEADDKNRDIWVYRLIGFYDEFTLVGQSNSSANGITDTTVDARTQNYYYSYSTMNVCRDSVPPIPGWFKFGTIHLSAFEGLNGKNELIWNSYYNEESQYEVVSRYNIYHSEDGENYSLIDSTLGSSIEDYEGFINLKYTHLNPTQSNYYMIEVVYPDDSGNRSSGISIFSNVGQVNNEFTTNIDNISINDEKNIIMKGNNALMEGFKGQTMNLYNISGQLIQQELISNNIQFVELLNINSGIHFVKAGDTVKKVYLR